MNANRLTPGQLADYAGLDFAELMPADAAAVVALMRDALVGEIERLREERTKYVLVPKWEYELLEQQRERAARAESERDRYRTAWRSARFRAQAFGEGILRHVADRDTWKSWCKQAELRGGSR